MEKFQHKYRIPSYPHPFHYLSHFTVKWAENTVNSPINSIIFALSNALHHSVTADTKPNYSFFKIVCL